MGLQASGKDSLETRNQKFKRLAERRVNEILDKLRSLGQLSDKRNYEYHEGDVAKIFKAIDSEVKLTKSRFNNGSTNRKRFTL